MFFWCLWIFAFSSTAFSINFPLGYLRLLDNLIFDAPRRVNKILHIIVLLIIAVQMLYGRKVGIVKNVTHNLDVFVHRPYSRFY